MSHYKCVILKSLLNHICLTRTTFYRPVLAQFRSYNTDFINTNSKIKDKNDTNFKDKIRNFFSLRPSDNLLSILKNESQISDDVIVTKLEELPQTELLDLLENEELSLNQRGPVFKESFKRCKEYDSKTLVRVISYFVASQVHPEMILILIQVLLNDIDVNQNQLINLVASFFNSSSDLLEVVTPALIVIFRKIELEEISGELLNKMWSRLGQKLNLRELQALARYLMPLTVRNVASLTNAELKNILEISSNIKLYSNNFLKFIINDVIVNRSKDPAPLTDLISRLIHNMSKSTYYDEKALDVFSTRIDQEINENNFENEHTILPFVFAKINHPIPLLLHKLVNLSYEKFNSSKSYSENFLQYHIDLRRCAIGCAIFNYYPKKFVNILFSDESINFAKEQFSSRGLDSYAVQLPQIYYSAIASGVDIKLSEENIKTLRYISMNCCRESWITSLKFGSPWELRVMYTLSKRFFNKLYREWPTLASYRIDGCLFFDKDNALIRLPNTKFYNNRLKAFQMFTESGLPGYSDEVNASVSSFRKIWDCAVAEETYNDVAKKIAIEMVGPSHYLHTDDGDYRLEGVNAMRFNYLKALGWRVLTIPFYEYKSFTSNNLFLDYFQKKLNNILEKN